MTMKEAKEICIEVWTYLAENPEIARKVDLPPELFEKIQTCVNHCPLCVLFYDHWCEGCPLGDCFAASAFERWIDPLRYITPSHGNQTVEDARRAAAWEIVDAISAWEV